MKHCQPCNLGFPAGFRFCGSCGGGLSDSIDCAVCGELVESKWKFCTGCGTTLRLEPNVVESERASTPHLETVSQPQRRAELISPSVREWYAAPELFEEAEETTAASIRVSEVASTPIRQPDSSQVGAAGNGASSRKGKEAPTLTMLSGYGRPDFIAKAEATSLQPVLVLGLIAFFAMVGFGGWYLWTYRTSAAASKTEATPAQEPTATSRQFASASVGETPAKRGEAESANDEWKRLKQERISASGSQHAAIIASLEEAEKKYPRDYRFPYERAKLSVKGIVSHHEAFSALASAAEKAIDNGKAQEMLANLMAEQDGDFYKLARGHHEWHAVQEALGNNDKRPLKTMHN